MNKAFLETKVETGAVNASLENSISGIKISKAFVSHESEEEKFEKGNIKFINAREKAYKVMAEYFSGAGFGIDILNYVGLIGGGKTTFCNLIPRFYEVESGDILIDNKSIYDVKLDSLRESIGIVQTFT
jgi:ATP-binding cassette subfamily B protein